MLTRTDLSDLRHLTGGIKWLIGFRAGFALVLFFSTLVFCHGENLNHFDQPFASLYGISLVLMTLSISYALMLRIVQFPSLFAYFQLALDSFSVTAIIFITGGFDSIFTFLYLVIIIGASMLVYRQGSLIVASLCSIQYGVLVDLQYYGILKPFGPGSNLADLVEWPQVIYKIVMIVIACFAVAVLSGILSLQAKRARRELVVVEAHLRRVERMAAMGELASSMAHEIKNPLASLSGAIQLLKDDTEPGTKNFRLMQIVLRETQRLSNLVTDFLVFAKPQTGDAVSLKLDQIIQEILEIFRQDALCRDRITVNFRPVKPAWVQMGPGHFRQILWNLLKNAAEAIDGTGTIEVSLYQARNSMVRLTVRDSGCGIPDSAVESIFDPFFTTKTNGTGLGLSIILRIIDTYQGMIDVETRPGQGTLFTVMLPSVPEATKP